MKDPIPPTTNSRAMTRGCLLTMTALDFMASVTFKFPKTISGTVREVNNEIRMAIMLSITIIPMKLKTTEMSPPVKLISKAAVNRRKK